MESISGEKGGMYVDQKKRENVNLWERYMAKEMGTEVRTAEDKLSILLALEFIEIRMKGCREMT